MRLTKCCLCGDTIDTESPYVIYAPNPETFRVGWQHAECHDVAYEELAQQPAQDRRFEHRQEEYDRRFAD